MAGYSQEQSSVSRLNQIIRILDDNNVTIFDILAQVLRFGHVAQNLHASEAALRTSVIIADLLFEQEETAIRSWAADVTVDTYRTELAHLIQAQQGLHFRVNHEERKGRVCQTCAMHHCKRRQST